MSAKCTKDTTSPSFTCRCPPPPARYDLAINGGVGNIVGVQIFKNIIFCPERHRLRSRRFLTKSIAALSHPCRPTRSALVCHSCNNGNTTSFFEILLQRLLLHNIATARRDLERSIQKIAPLFTIKLRWSTIATDNFSVKLFPPIRTWLTAIFYGISNSL